MRKIAANLIFPVASAPIKNGYLVIDTDGTIVEIMGSQDNIREIAGLEYYSGVLIPGMALVFSRNNKVMNLDKLPENLNAEQKKWARYLFSRGVQAVGSNIVFSTLAKTQTYIDYLIKLVQNKISFEDALQQLTIGNAQILHKNEQIGTFEVGKQPGVLLLSDFEFKTQTLGLNASIKRLV